MSTHYHVISGSGGGYTPNDNYRVEGIRDARRKMRDDVEQQRFDDSEAGYVWERSGPNAWIRRSKMVRAAVIDADNLPPGPQYRPVHPYDLGYYVEVAPCHEADCDDDSE